MTAVTFDFGQTLAELDTDFLAARVAERGAFVSARALDAASPAAWAEYDAAKRQGKVGRDAWQAFLRALLVQGHLETRGESLDSLLDFFWDEQPRRNLWRRPIPGMLELVNELRDRGLSLAIVSNSEGRLATLVAELGFDRAFPVVADSGVLGFEKPDRRIFDWTTTALGVDPGDFVHVGDAWTPDVEGALGVGARAIWVTSSVPPGRTLPEGVAACSGATEIRATLAAWGVL